jgi:hypothetical protein
MRGSVRARQRGRRRTRPAGRSRPARAGRSRAAATAGEKLSYAATYLFFRFASVEIENLGFTELHGRRVTRVVFSVRSNPNFPLLRIDSRFESFIAEDGSMLAHRSSSRDSTQARRAAAYDMDPATGRCVVRQVVGGCSVSTGSARRSPRTGLRPPARRGWRDAGSCRSSRPSTAAGEPSCARWGRKIRWAGRDVEAVKVEAIGHYEGPAGLSGRVLTWISRDGRAIPYKAKIKVALGSVVLSLRDEAPQTRQAAR